MLIGLVGKAGTGKSTIGDYLKQKYGFMDYNFADSLKQMAMLFGYSHKNLYGSQQDKEVVHPVWKVSARVFLQRVGTELFRNQFGIIFPEWSGSVWIDIMSTKLDSSKNSVICDVRFVDEAEFIKKSGGILIKLERQTEFNYNHKSETELNTIACDHIIVNDSSVENLYKKIDKIILN